MTNAYMCLVKLEYIVRGVQLVGWIQTKINTCIQNFTQFDKL
jgi:hypothetical protein